MPPRETVASLGGVVFSRVLDLGGVVLSSALHGSGEEPLQWSDQDVGSAII